MDIESNPLSVFFEKMSLYSPIIIIIGVFMVSLFAGSISKGLTYVFCIIVAGVLRHAFLNPDNSTNSSSYQKIKQTGGRVGDCNMGINKYGDNSTLGLFVLAFTSFYICVPMFIINSINWLVILLFIFYMIGEYFMKNSNKCFIDPNSTTNICVNILFGSLLGLFMTVVVYSKLNSWSYTNIVSSNKEVCSMASEQTFRCDVYKNGEILASTTA
jgi:hypothetical protein